MSSYMLHSPTCVKAVEDKPTLQLSSKGITGAGLSIKRNDAELVYSYGDNWLPLKRYGSEGNKNLSPSMGWGSFTLSTILTKGNNIIIKILKWSDLLKVKCVVDY